MRAGAQDAAKLGKIVMYLIELTFRFIARIEFYIRFYVYSRFQPTTVVTTVYGNNVFSMVRTTG